MTASATAQTAAAASSNQPPNKPDKEHAAPDNGGTEQVPFVVKEVPREHSAEETQQNAEKRELDRKVAGYTADLADYTKRLFGATLALAVLTGLLFAVAVYQIREGQKSTQAAEDAAKAASDSAKSTAELAKYMERQAKIAEITARHVERPYAFLEIVHIMYAQDISLLASSSANKCIEIQYKIINHGRTPAIIYQCLFTVNYIIFGKEKLVPPVLPPALPDYSSAVPQYVMEMLSPGRETFAERHKLPSREDVDNTPTGDIPVIFGYLRYRDVAGRHYQSGFGYTWVGGKLRPSNDRYNYDREIEPAEMEAPTPST